MTKDSHGYLLMNDAVMMRETKAALADTGLRLSDIELVQITPRSMSPRSSLLSLPAPHSARVTSSPRLTIATMRACLTD